MQIGIVNEINDRLHIRRPTKFTPERLEQIRNLVERGRSAEEIAEVIGCTPGTLKVTCSRLGVSLRRPRYDANGEERRPPRSSRAMTLAIPQDEPPDEPAASPAPAEDGPRQEPIQPIPPATFSLRFQYRDRVLDTPLNLSTEQVTRLALEAELRGLKLGELLAQVVAGAIDRL